MGAWTNNKATAIPVKSCRPGNLTKPVKPTDLEKNPGAKAVEGKHQDAAIEAAGILARALRSQPLGVDRNHVTVTMTGTSSNPPVNGDTITVTVTLAAAPSPDKESDVAGRV